MFVTVERGIHCYQSPLFHHLGHKERYFPGPWPGVSPALRPSLAKLPLMEKVQD